MVAGRNRGRSGDKAVAYLAVAFVAAGGILFVSVAVLLFSPDPPRVFGIMGAVTLGCLFLVWLVSDHRDGRSLKERYGALIGLGPKKEKVKVKVKRVKRSEMEGPNRPPSVDDIRGLSEGTNTWVPSGGRRQSDADC
ncbi:hypothetical protein CA54_14240 [Symmachiella macrocystis]|uniref:Uncharacterized protein n=1 Tax=Symmachiella macrocystis TaxID=2527985 RepID=A0A5C6BKL7_9PLAN|nr:hypothetical protein [Symmachiella macrocystis]TWU12600.1 hypothetical protein CA54_14240 [Symmachiella macrocystis]